MSKLAVLPGAKLDIKTMLKIAEEEHGEIKNAIVITFDKDGGMWTQYCAGDQQLALASVRLAHLANLGD